MERRVSRLQNPTRVQASDPELARRLGTLGDRALNAKGRDHSDARRLQAALEVRYRVPQPSPRWSRRRTLTFAIVASGLLWAIVIAAVGWGLRLISG